MSMTAEERRIAGAIFNWLEIRDSQGDGLARPITAAALAEDAQHSGLLPRLLGGIPPLPAPPPLSFGQPWYAIVEEGHADSAYVEELQGDLARLYPGTILINRFPWTVLEHAEADSWLVTWCDGGPEYWLARIKGSSSPMPFSLHRLDATPAA